MNRTLRWLVPLAVFVALALALYAYLSPRYREESPPPEADIAPQPAAPPAARHPIEAVQPAPSEEPPEEAGPAPLPTLGESDAAVEAALQGLTGGSAVVEFLNIGPHLRHLVATVDSLPTKKTSTRVWPVKRTPGPFLVEDPSAAETRMADENADRYTPFVDLVASVDTGRAVALYVRFYPLLQQAYEELGYPGRHFNDRVVEVIDHLLATPEPDGPVAVVLPPLDPTIDVERPWVLYEFADPGLESLSAGQKVLIRVGPQNSARLRSKLAELRGRLASGPPPAAAAPR